MGKIEDVVFENYIRSLQEGDLDQAKKAVRLIEEVKRVIEKEGFIDYPNENTQSTQQIPSNYFEPFCYEYDTRTMILTTPSGLIPLSKGESDLFMLFHENQSYDDQIKIIGYHDIRLATNSKESRTAKVRVRIHRLKKKIEKHTQTKIFFTYRKAGYVFLAKGSLK